MNRAFHIGIVMAVVLHMLCGCCLHHAHAYDGPSDLKAVTVEACCPCCDGNAAPCRCCDPRSSHQPCDGGRCVFTRPDSNDAPDLSIGHGCVNLVCVSPGIPTLRGIDRADSSLGKPGGSIPLHLLNQALLL